MSRYSQQTNYYDPTGSQSQQPSGYTYQTPTTSASQFTNPSAPSSYASNYQYGGTAYGTQQYAPNVEQQSRNSASNAAVALSSLSSHNYGPASASTRQDQYGNSAWYNNSAHTSNTYGAQSSGTFGRLSAPESTQNSSNTFGPASSYQSAPASAASNSRQTAYTQQQSQPPRYNSPLQAVQAQQRTHAKQDSRGSNTQQQSQSTAQAARPAQQKNPIRQQSASVEPSPTTVDPSQVYDNRAELQRKAQIEAEKRRKYEAEQAAKKEEEERVAAEKRMAEQEQKRKEEEEQKKEAKKKADQEKRNEQRRKAREDKKQSNGTATALQTMGPTAAGEASGPAAGANGPTDEAAEMRAMFQKMREFNAKNPSMLAKLWEEERKSHAQVSRNSSQPATASPAPNLQNPASVPPAPSSAQSGAKPSKKSAGPARATPVSAPKAPPAAPMTAASPPGPQAPPAATTNQSTNNLWPPHKKDALADATARWLRLLPQNANSIITSHSVLSMLDKNPSYVQLCEMLEAIGLKFERAALARELLRAVPDGAKSQSQVAKAARPSNAKSPALAGSGVSMNSSASQPRESSTSTVNYEAPISLSDAAREVNGMRRPGSVPGTAYGAQIHQGTQSPYFTPSNVPPRAISEAAQLQPPEVKQETKPQESTKPPADKEEAARKRTFGDLVDLTAEESDEEPPLKKISLSTPGFANQQAAPPKTYPNQAGFNQYAYSSMQSNGKSSSHKTSTLGLSVAGTSGEQQPTHQPVVPAQPIKPKGPSLEQQQHLRMKGKMLVEPIMRDRVARKSKYDSRTLARDVLLATGRHPDMRGLNAHLATMQKLLGQHGGETHVGDAIGLGGVGNRSDLATIRWDIIDPEPAPSEDVRVKGMERRATLEAGLSGDEPAMKKTAARTVEYEVPSESNATVSSSDHRTKPRKNRPSKEHFPHRKPIPLTNGFLGEASNAPASAPRPSKTSQSSSRPATPASAPAPSAKINGNMSSATPVGYAAFRQIADDGTVVKKKGRPVGWRKAIHSREAQGLEPKSSASLASRTKPSSAVTSTEVVEPQYQVYKCKWKDCKAKLHNLETLKKHVIRLHGSPTEEEKFECWWKGCGVEERKEGRVKTFDSIEDWLGHVDEVHLSPIRWKLGDGPKADHTASQYDSRSPSERPLPTYLLDADARSVTPLISLPSSDEAATTKPTYSGRGRPPKDGIARIKTGAGAAIEAPLKKLEEHKRIVGPLMDRMGCVLVDDGRRAGFLDDEDFEDLMEDHGLEFPDDQDILVW